MVYRMLLIAAGFALGIANILPASAQDKMIKIGAPLPLTGAVAPEGLKQKQGIDLWANAVNKAGGIKADGARYKVELVYADYESSTPMAVQLTQRLITQDHVNFIFSPFGSGPTEATSTVSERYKILAISPSASAEQVYQQGFKYMFGTLTSNEARSKQLVSYIKAAAPGVKKVAVYARNDLLGLSLATGIEATAKQNGFDVVWFEKYPINAIDHAAALTELRAKGADWIYVSGYTDDLIRIRQQMMDLKVSAPVVTMLAGPYTHEFTDSLGDAANGVTSMTYWHPSLALSGPDVFGSTANYAKLYEAAYHTVPDYAEASASAAAVVLQMAIEKAGTIDTEKVRTILASTEFHTFYGPIKFGPTGQNIAGQNPIFQIQAHKIVIIAPDSLKQGNLQLIK